MDRAAFADAIANSALGRVPAANTAVDELFAEYDRVLSERADRFAPANIVKTQAQPLSPWSDSECRATRRVCKRLERQFRRTYSDAARQAWIAVLRQKHALYETKKTQYWQARLRNEGVIHRVFCGDLWIMSYVVANQSGLSTAPAPTVRMTSSTSLRQRFSQSAHQQLAVLSI